MRTCDTGDCDGSGWRPVQDAYAHHEAAKTGDAPDTRRYQAALAAARNTTYPCRSCNATMFYRWAGGHLTPEHDRGSCGECIDAGARGERKPGGRRRREAGEPSPPPPTDEDYERATAPDFATRAAGNS